MGFAKHDDPIVTFKWSELNKRIFKCVVIEPRPDLNEPIGQVYLVDENMKTYLIHEWCRAEDAERVEAKFYEVKK